MDRIDRLRTTEQLKVENVSYCNQPNDTKNVALRLKKERVCHSELAVYHTVRVRTRHLFFL